MLTVFFRTLACLLVFVIYSISNAWGQYDFSGLDQLIVSKKRVLGGNVCVLIQKDGQIIHEQTIGSYTENTVEPVASCSKWFTAALVMTFVDEGKLSVDDYVGKYLPEFSKDGKEYIKIKHCLSHTSGIESEPVGLGSLMAHRKFKSLAEEVASFASKPMSGEPGKVFSYSTVGLNIVGRILEVISGKDFETLFQERIARPLGMSGTTFSTGHAVNPSGGAISTPSDYMKFLSMILNHGVYKDKEILSAKSIAQMQVSQTSRAKILYVPEGGEGFEYAFGEWVQKKDTSGNGLVISSPGLFGTYPVIDKTRNYAAIVFVKNLMVKSRKEIYMAVITAIDQALDKTAQH